MPSWGSTGCHDVFHWRGPELSLTSESLDTRPRLRGGRGTRIQDTRDRLGRGMCQDRETATQQVLRWRRERDSNPRRLAPRSFSRAVHSSALPSLLEERFMLRALVRTPRSWQRSSLVAPGRSRASWAARTPPVGSVPKSRVATMRQCMVQSNPCNHAPAHEDVGVRGHRRDRHRRARLTGPTVRAGARPAGRGHCLGRARGRGQAPHGASTRW